MHASLVVSKIVDHCPLHDESFDESGSFQYQESKALVTSSIQVKNPMFIRKHGEIREPKLLTSSLFESPPSPDKPDRSDSRWIEKFSVNYGKPYWKNKATKDVVWKNPHKDP